MADPLVWIDCAGATEATGGSDARRAAGSWRRAGARRGWRQRPACGGIGVQEPVHPQRVLAASAVLLVVPVSLVYP
jgi:hypothetical protein